MRRKSLVLVLVVGCIATAMWTMVAFWSMSLPAPAPESIRTGPAFIHDLYPVPTIALPSRRPYEPMPYR